MNFSERELRLRAFREARFARAQAMKKELDARGAAAAKDVAPPPIAARKRKARKNGHKLGRKKRS